MPERREHYISAAYAEKEHDLTFSTLVRTSKDKFLGKPVINIRPPPEREVVLVIGVSNYDSILNSSLEKVFGFVFEGGLFLDGLNVKSEFLEVLGGLLHRVLRQHQKITP